MTEVPLGLRHHAIMSDFIRAVVNGRLHKVVMIGGKSVLADRRYRPKCDITAPVFDFVDLDLDALWGRMPEPLTVEMLPYPECFFVFRDVARALDRAELAPCRMVYHVTADHGGVTVGTFVSAVEGVWFSETTIRFSREGPLQAEVSTKPDTAWCRAYTAFLLASLLGNTLAIREREHVPVRVPTAAMIGRGKKRREVPPVCVLHLNREYLEKRKLPHSAEPGSGPEPGSPKSPHDRRAHFRRLRDGRVIPVRASRVHGGSPDGRLYVVKE